MRIRDNTDIGQFRLALDGTILWANNWWSRYAMSAETMIGANAKDRLDLSSRRKIWTDDGDLHPALLRDRMLAPMRLSGINFNGAHFTSILQIFLVTKAASRQDRLILIDFGVNHMLEAATILRATINDVAAKSREILKFISRIDKLPATVSPAEYRVAMCIKNTAASSKEIAAQIGISPRTVETHRSSLRSKLQLGADEDLVTALKRYEI
ncbi:MAG: LuxR C-terminal-related transcriptional regulator [Pseudomonadota bacterium]